MTDRGASRQVKVRIDHGRVACSSRCGRGAGGSVVKRVESPRDWRERRETPLEGSIAGQYVQESAPIALPRGEDTIRVDAETCLDLI